MTDFKNSETKLNLMRAFAGESQARNRYTFAASVAKAQKLYTVEAVFNFTAGQEKEHAEIFYNHLKECAGENIKIDGAYPVDIDNNVEVLLKYAVKNECEEGDDVYPAFEKKAREEGFNSVAASFKMIAEIEKTHAERFKMFKELMESNKMFSSDGDVKWMCLNCGHIHSGKNVPEVCPVCNHDKGYFIRYNCAPYSCFEY